MTARCVHATGITGCRSSRCSNFEKGICWLSGTAGHTAAVPKYSELSILRGADHSPMLIQPHPYRRFKDVCLLSGTAGHTRCRSEIFGAVDPSRRRPWDHADPIFLRRRLPPSACALCTCDRNHGVDRRDAALVDFNTSKMTFMCCLAQRVKPLPFRNIRSCRSFEAQTINPC